MMDFQTFKEKIKTIKVVYSVSRNIPYKICSIQGNILTIHRESTDNDSGIDLQELYEFYKNENRYTTTNAKKYGLDYAQSPSVAIIKELTRS